MLNWVTIFRIESTFLDAMNLNKEIREMIVGVYHSHRY
jgi:proteasome lid subunit RPN8/RPN11